MNDERDDELDDVLDHADEAAERDVALHVPPSFAAVVARARRIDPSTVAADTRTDRIPSHGMRGVGAHDTSQADAKLIAPFVLQAREDAEDDIAERERAGVPPWRVRPLVRVRAWTLLGGVMAAAAATIFALGLVEGWRATRVDESPHAQSLAGVDTSPDVHEATQNDGGAQEPASVPRRHTPEAAGRPTPPPPSIAPALPPAEEAPVPDAIGEMLERASSPKETRSGAAKVPRESLKQLDLRAQAALAAGDRELADKLYTQLIARGQKEHKQHPLVELAYGERFALARPHGASAQRSLWRAYLSSFPQGRFADDAEAGLCRTAAAHDKTRCWSAYVAAFPTGAYRDHADRWVADTSTP